ncbi:hypothetical protein JTE90_022708 [Oedothorax gibbosus]|uniref:Uncharacterized protein n=1 Tax=Oedothorax gibbosus TaxID=931172 RepID=A0AAV6UPD4_9ARAC|nr:hypothetical protein JTE90_022708 [Oedothorax gibbosus]
MNKILCLWIFCVGISQVLAQKKYLIYKTDDGYDVSPKTHQNYVHKAQPYKFGYNIKDAKGNSQYHKEVSDEHNYRTGSYGYTDAYGIYRHVDYVADHEGFRAKVRTNEPGTANSHPADVYMHAEQPPHHLQELYHEPIKAAYSYPQKDQHYQQQNQHYGNAGQHYQQKDQHYQQEEVAQEQLYHDQKPVYEEYIPNVKEKVSIVPVYVPQGNVKSSGYHH